MRIPFGNLLKQYKSIQKEIDKAILRVMNSGWFILGKEVENFEKEFSKYCGAKYCIGVGNGLEAIQIALMACGVQAGDEVITTPLSAVATSLAISHIGAIPVYVDINHCTYNIDPTNIEKKITSKTKAILPVHLFGQMAEMEEILRIAKKHNLFVIEDVAQAHGAHYGGKKAGTYGNFGAFSFYPSKNLGAYGDAGALITDDDILAKKARILRDYGQENRYEHSMMGLNSRLDEQQAAIVSTKLEYLDRWNARRKTIAQRYSEALKNLPLVLPREKDPNSHVWHLYVLQTDQRDELRRFLEEKEIATQIHYPKAIYLQKAYEGYKFKKGLCPTAEEITGKILSLPIYPELTDEEVEYICKSIKDFFES